MSLSGWCAYLAVRRYSRHWISAVVGGLIYEFSPFMAVQITGHAHLFVAVFPPLLVLLADEILVRQRHRAWLIGVLLGVAAAAQLLTGTELLTISVLMAIPALITLAVIFRARLRERMPYMIRAAGFAAATFVVLAGYPLYILFFGPGRVSGALQGTGFVARPTSFLVPSAFELIGGSSTVLNSSVYIGVPLLLLAVAVTIRMRRHPVVVAAAVTVACAMVLALGGNLTLHGSATGIPLPWLLPQSLPLLDNVLPVRLMVAGYLALALIVAVFLDRVLEAPLRWRIAGLAAAAVALVPVIPTLPISAARFVIPPFFTDGAASRLPTTGSVLMTPYGNGVPDYPPEVWQAISGLDFQDPDRHGLHARTRRIRMGPGDGRPGLGAQRTGKRGAGSHDTVSLPARYLPGGHARPRRREHRGRPLERPGAGGAVLHRAHGRARGVDRRRGRLVRRPSLRPR